MARKFYGEKEFTATVSDGTQYTFVCKTQDTSYGFRHVAFEGYFGGVVAKACYYNRTWECFRYETVLRQAIEKQPKEHQEDLIKVLIKGEQLKAEEEAEAMFNSFKTAFEGLSDKNKQILQNANIHLETAEQAQGLTAVMNMMNILDSI